METPIISFFGIDNQATSGDQELFCDTSKKVNSLLFPSLLEIFYFRSFSRVVTLISLLAALKEPCSPSGLHIYCEQGYIPQ